MSNNLYALTVIQPYAHLIASGLKTLELRTRQLLKAGQRVVIAAGSTVDLAACERLGLDPASLPRSVTLCLVECISVFGDASLPTFECILKAACVDKTQNTVAHHLRVIKQLPRMQVRGNFGLWPLRPQRHSKDAGFVL